MFEKILKNVERFVTRSTATVKVIDTILNKLVPQNIALAIPCPSCPNCSPNCKTQVPRVVLYGAYAICVCVDTTIGCQPC